MNGAGMAELAGREINNEACPCIEGAGMVEPMVGPWGIDDPIPDPDADPSPSTGTSRLRIDERDASAGANRFFAG